MTDLIEVDGLNADLEVVEDVVEVVELAEQGPAGPPGADGAAGANGADGAPGLPGSDANVTPANVATAIAGGAEKTVPVDGDRITLLDSAAAFAMSWLSWANIKATLKTYFDTIYAAVSSLAGKIDKVATIVDKSTSFNTNTLDDVTDNAKIYNATAALTITLETYTDKPEGFQAGIFATGGIVTFAGTFAGKPNCTKLAQGDAGYLARKANGWHVGGLTL